MKLNRGIPMFDIFTLLALLALTVGAALVWPDSFFDEGDA